MDICLSLDRAEAACASAYPLELSFQGLLAYQIASILLAPLWPFLAILDFEIWRYLLDGPDLQSNEKHDFVRYYFGLYWFFYPIVGATILIPLSYFICVNALRRSATFFRILKWLFWIAVATQVIDAASAIMSFPEKGPLWSARKTVAGTCTAIVTYCIFRYVRSAKLSNVETTIAASLLKRDGRKAAIFLMLGIPRAISRLSLRKYLIIPFFVLSSIAYYNIYRTVEKLQGTGTRNDRFANEICTKVGAECYQHYAFWSFVFLASVPFLILLWALLAAVLAYLGRRLSTVRLKEVQKHDPRRPVVFLRSFNDDQVKLARPTLNVLGYLAEFGRPKTNLDILLLEEATPFGPVVALGNPNDLRPPYGAARGYVTPDEWQALVSKVAEDALAIVIVVDDTDGVWWEVDHVIANEHLQKTLFLLHPSRCILADNQQLFLKLCEKLERTNADLTHALRGQLSETTAQARNVIGFFAGENDALRLGLASHANRLTYLLMVRWFLRTGVVPAQ